MRELVKLFPLRRRRMRLRRGPGLAVHAVDGVSLDILRGECLALVGESGSGKTTLANCIAGAIVPTSGEIFLDDVVLARDGRFVGLPRRERARRIQMVFQDPTSALNPRLTVRRTLSEPISVHGLDDQQPAARLVDDLLERVGLPADAVHRYPHELNASQRQRVVIARALALRPEVLIADEPIAKLDVSMQGQILNLLGELREELGLTVLFITHDLSVVRQIADRVAVLYLGQLMELASTEVFFAAASHPYSQALLKSTPRLRTTAVDLTLFTIRGEIPSPINVPPGCPFLSRCPEGDASCALERPPLLAVAEGTEVACWKRYERSPSGGGVLLAESSLERLA